MVDESFGGEFQSSGLIDDRRLTLNFHWPHEQVQSPALEKLDDEFDLLLDSPRPGTSAARRTLVRVRSKAGGGGGGAATLGAGALGPGAGSGTTLPLSPSPLGAGAAAVGKNGSVSAAEAAAEVEVGDEVEAAATVPALAPAPAPASASPTANSGAEEEKPQGRQDEEKVEDLPSKVPISISNSVEDEVVAARAPVPVSDASVEKVQGSAAKAEEEIAEPSKLPQPSAPASCEEDVEADAASVPLPALDIAQAEEVAQGGDESESKTPISPAEPSSAGAGSVASPSASTLLGASLWSSTHAESKRSSAASGLSSVTAVSSVLDAQGEEEEQGPAVTKAQDEPASATTEIEVVDSATTNKEVASEAEESKSSPEVPKVSLPSALPTPTSSLPQLSRAKSSAALKSGLATPSKIPASSHFGFPSSSGIQRKASLSALRQPQPRRGSSPVPLPEPQSPAMEKAASHPAPAQPPTVTGIRAPRAKASDTALSNQFGFGAGAAAVSPSAAGPNFSVVRAVQKSATMGPSSMRNNKGQRPSLPLSAVSRSRSQSPNESDGGGGGGATSTAKAARSKSLRQMKSFDGHGRSGSPLSQVSGLPTPAGRRPSDVGAATRPSALPRKSGIPKAGAAIARWAENASAPGAVAVAGAQQTSSSTTMPAPSGVQKPSGIAAPPVRARGKA